MRVLFDGPIVRESSVCAKLIAYCTKIEAARKNRTPESESAHSIYFDSTIRDFVFLRKCTFLEVTKWAKYSFFATLVANCTNMVAKREKWTSYSGSAPSS